jgi:hypothetical protein
MENIMSFSNHGFEFFNWYDNWMGFPKQSNCTWWVTFVDTGEVIRSIQQQWISAWAQTSGRCTAPVLSNQVQFIIMFSYNSFNFITSL